MNTKTPENKKSGFFDPRFKGFGGACRQSARNVLKNSIRRAEGNIETLRILERVIPWDDLSEEDESKLWNYFIERR
jgi:hypothetical protein